MRVESGLPNHLETLGLYDGGGIQGMSRILGNAKNNSCQSRAVCYGPAQMHRFGAGTNWICPGINAYKRTNNTSQEEL
jgi:hypothetical protein